MSVGNRKCRQNTVAELQIKIAATGDLDRILQGGRYVRKQFGHFLGGSQVLIRAVQSRTVRVGETATLVDTNTRFVGIEIIAIQKSHIVCRNDGNLRFTRERQARLHAVLFPGATGTNKLQIEPPGECFLPIE